MQDASQPQHVRNEQHLDKFIQIWKSPIEKYGGKYVRRLDYPTAMLDWKAAGFNKLKDFWDRGLYLWSRSIPTLGTSGPLSDHEDIMQPQSRLGIAEFVNGNFLADRHSYRETLPETDPFYYPYPSLLQGTDFLLMMSQPGMHGKATGIAGALGVRYITTKTSQGRAVSHHAAVSYLNAMNPYEPSLSSPVLATIDDPDVLKVYHDILIPEAVKYSAGVIDYFFRGRLAVGTTFTSTPGKVGLRIANISGQTLRYGTFKLYYEDAAGTRTQIAAPAFTTTYSGELADNGQITGEFTAPSPAPTAYFLIYQGVIGAAGVVALDSVDSQSALAVKRFTREAFIDVLNLNQVNDLAEDGTVIGHANISSTQRPYYYSGLTRTSQDTRSSIDSSPVTVSQAGTTVTANDTFFSSAHVGRIMKFSSGETATITAYVSPTQVTVTPSQSVSATTLLLQGNTLGGNNGAGRRCTSRFFAGQEQTPSSGDGYPSFWLDTLTGEIRNIAGPFSQVQDIDEAGWVLLYDLDSVFRARLYNPMLQTFTDLGLLGGSEDSSPVAMNAAHVVALNSSFSSGSPSGKASRWSGGTITSIHPAAAGTSASSCWAINANGTIIGQFNNSDAVGQAFINFGGASIPVGDPMKITYFSAINDNDVVAGGQEDAAGYNQPFKWTLAGGFEFIPLLTGTDEGGADAINNAGDVVGQMEGAGGSIAFLRRGTTTHKLIDLIAGIPGATGWTSLGSAYFINDNNDIVGFGFHSGVFKAYRLHLPP